MASDRVIEMFSSDAAVQRRAPRIATKPGQGGERRLEPMD